MGKCEEPSKPSVAEMADMAKRQLATRAFVCVVLLAVAMSAPLETDNAHLDDGVGEAASTTTNAVPECECDPNTPSTAECCLSKALQAKRPNKFICTGETCAGVSSVADGFCIECRGAMYQDCARRTNSDIDQSGSYGMKIASYGCTKFWRMRQYIEKCTCSDGTVDGTCTGGTISPPSGANKGTGPRKGNKNDAQKGKTFSLVTKQSKNKCRIIEKNVENNWAQQRL